MKIACKDVNFVLIHKTVDSNDYASLPEPEKMSNEKEEEIKVSSCDITISKQANCKKKAVD